MWGRVGWLKKDSVCYINEPSLNVSLETDGSVIYMVLHLENVEPFLSGTKGMSVIVNFLDMRSYCPAEGKKDWQTESIRLGDW